MRPFGELEADIMRVMWASDEPLNIHSMVEVLHREGRQPAYTTVMTVTERLRTKGWLGRVKQGRSFQYTALRSADDYSADLMDQALDSSADRESALLRFAGRLDPGEAAALRRALEAMPAESDPDD
ncbi:BlaI/MecI/CopY family transcriptional regulator [Streptomyces sp. NPDC006349]|uniref:BlaI/MecI/CopY family transcriptional regulator n=1 Tax=Streptomyces sp. NPDC006349 TaxID=3156757 RepID=UPI0006BA0166|nr:CopY family transcriptional regulator [Streptomyces sp. NRRL WC-3753]